MITIDNASTIDMVDAFVFCNKISMFCGAVYNTALLTSILLFHQICFFAEFGNRFSQNMRHYELICD